MGSVWNYAYCRQVTVIAGLQELLEWGDFVFPGDAAVCSFVIDGKGQAHWIYSEIYAVCSGRTAALQKGILFCIVYLRNDIGRCID